MTWNEVSGLFWRRDAIPATFIDQTILVEQVEIDVFGKPDMEVAERRALALFKLVTQEGERYTLTVIYLPYHQKEDAHASSVAGGVLDCWEASLPWLACPRIPSNVPTCQSPQMVSTTPCCQCVETWG